MAEELKIVNGGDADYGNRTAENDGISNGDDDLTVGNDGKAQKIETLEQERSKLMSENDKSKDRIKVLMEEIEGLKRNDVEMKERMVELQRDNERFEEDKKALHVITVRAAELETEVCRLQHDLISSTSESEETMAELRELKNEFENLKQRYEEKELKVQDLEKEKVCLLEGIDREAEKAKEALTESEKRVRDFDANLSVMEELKVKIAEKERDILRLQKEKKENEALISSLNEALKDLRGEFDLMKEKAVRLENELEESQKVGREFIEKDLLMNNSGGSRNGVKGLRSLEFQWPVALASAGTVAAAVVVIYVGYSKRR